MATAIVVGSGPNGMAAAVRLAMAGVDVTVLEAHSSVGGGTRTEELTLPGLLHDVCSAVHPFAVASPYLSTLPLGDEGLRWRHPDVALAHPLDDGRAGVLLRSLDETVADMGVDGATWNRLLRPTADNLHELATESFQPILHVPRHPIALARFGINAVQPATLVANRFRTDEVRALWAGVAAHAIQPLSQPLTAAVGLMLAAAAHAVGWPVAEGGSQAITRALTRLLERHGGAVQTDVRVTRWAQVADADVVLFDLAPRAVVEIMAHRLPDRVRRAYQRYRHGPGAFKVDLAVSGGVPWVDDGSRRAGTVHVGGTLEEVVRAEADVAAGRMPERPFVLVGQQHLADPTRSRGDVHPVWAYAHVPAGYDGDATELILAQMERFAPGLRERVLAVHTQSPAQFEEYNPNYVAGDIATGAADPIQVVFRPRVSTRPYSTGVPGAYLCSAASPPGAGTHGMCGANAADQALRHLGVGR